MRHRLVGISIYGLHSMAQARELWHSLRLLVRSASERMCVFPRTHNSFGDRSFSAAGPRVWNALPSYLQQHMNYKHFKKLLKIDMFRLFRHVQAKIDMFRRPRRIVTIVVFLHLRGLLTTLLTYFILDCECDAALSWRMFVSCFRTWMLMSLRSVITR